MVDKWSKLRLYSVHSNLKDNLDVLRSNLLRFGYLIKANLPQEYQKGLLHVDYSLTETIHDGVCVVLHFDKTRSDYDAHELVGMIIELTGTEVTVFEDTNTDLLLYVSVE